MTVPGTMAAPVPHYPESEKAVVAWAAFNASRPQRDRLGRQLLPEHFWVPWCRDLYRHTLDVHGPFDPSGLSAAVKVPRDRIESLYQLAPFSPAADAERIMEASARRSAIAAAQELAGMARDPGHDLDSVVAALATASGRLEVPTLRALGPPPSTVTEFIDRGDTIPDWLCAGLLERTDRIILTAGEGLGKSLTLRQVAVCLAAGLQPFTFAPVVPVNVLLVELETSERIVRRWLADLTRLAASASTPDWNRLRVEVRPAGIDLATHRDQVWLEDAVAATGADLVCIGPLYKCYTGDAREEEHAREVARVFDDLRDVYGTAWLIEAHAPHQQAGRASRDLRPYGSSLWMRWPEMGIGLRGTKDGAVDVQMWRPPRDVRDWPRTLVRGDGWPWRDPDGPRFDSAPSLDEQEPF